LAVQGSVERVLLQPGGMDPPALEVVILKAGVANDLLFSEAVLEEAVDRFRQVPVFVDHATPADYRRPGGRSIRDLAGIIREPRWDPEGACIRGRLSLARSVGWLRQLIADFAPYPQIFGLSADLWLRRIESAEPPRQVTAIEEINSVDIVVRPAAGGRFLARWAPGAPMFAKEPPMSTHSNPIPLASDDAGTPPAERLVRAQTALSGADLPLALQSDLAPLGATAAPEDAAHAPASADAVAAEPAVALGRREMIDLALAASALPESLKDIIREDASIRTLAGARAAIERLSHTWAELTAQQAIRGLGAIASVRTPLDRITLAFERLMGVGGEPGAWNRGDTAAHREAPRLSGIREMYDLLTGDWERHGRYRPERALLANATATTMAEVVRNVLNKALVQAYEARPRWWEPVAYQEDFPTLNDARWITLGGFTDLDTVTEGNAYTEKTWDDYAETSAFVKKGNYLGLTLEMIDRDDVGAVRAIPRKLGHAAWRTLSAAVSALFTGGGGVGPTLSDGEALFDAAAHGNLGSSALEATAWHATVTAMYRQSEFHSSKPLGIRPSYCLVPIELENTAVNLFTTTLEPGLAGNTRAIEQATHSVVVVPEWTDTANWAAAAHPSDLPGVVIGYRFGRAPELFVADQPLMGSMFTNDEMRIKVRFVFSVGIGDYRALYKHNVG